MKFTVHKMRPYITWEEVEAESEEEAVKACSEELDLTDNGEEPVSFMAIREVGEEDAPETERKD